MYRILLLLVITLFVVRMIWIYRAGKWDFLQLKEALNKGLGILLHWLMMSEFKSENNKRFRSLFISVSVISFMILVFTGLIPVIIFGDSIGGLYLIIHVTIAPFFVLALMFCAIFMGHFQQFDNTDYNDLRKIRLMKESKDPNKNFDNVLPKINFWLFLIFSVPAILSIILSMFPYFGTEGQITMLNIHRYSILVLLIIALSSMDLKMRSYKNGKDKK